MKHERNIKPAPKQNWRLKKTLARRLDFRPIEDADVKFAYAAYKKGALAPMAGPFVQTEMKPVEFKATFEETVLSRYHGAWTLFGETPRGFVQIGMVFAFHSHADPALSPFMIIGDIVWFPWASHRNKVESAVNFFDKIRTSIPMMDYAHGDTNRRFFEMLCKHGVMRRIGTMFNLVKGEPTAVFETRVG